MEIKYSVNNWAFIPWKLHLPWSICLEECKWCFFKSFIAKNGHKKSNCSPLSKNKGDGGIILWRELYFCNMNTTKLWSKRKVKAWLTKNCKKMLLQVNEKGFTRRECNFHDIFFQLTQCKCFHELLLNPPTLFTTISIMNVLCNYPLMVNLF